MSTQQKQSERLLGNITLTETDHSDEPCLICGGKGTNINVYLEWDGGDSGVMVGRISQVCAETLKDESARLRLQKGRIKPA